MCFCSVFFFIYISGCSALHLPYYAQNLYLSVVMLLDYELCLFTTNDNTTGLIDAIVAAPNRSTKLNKVDVE